MSDLVPFVAAVLEEKVAADLKEEYDRLKKIDQLRKKDKWREKTIKGLRNAIKRLKAENDRALDTARWNGRVEITGNGGAPVYARGSMVHPAVWRVGRIDDEEETYRFELSFEKPQLATCPIRKAYSAEVRVNGVKVANVGGYRGYLNTFRDDDSDHGAYWFSPAGHKTPWGYLCWLRLTIGPFPDHSLWPSWNQEEPPIPSDFRAEDNVEVTFDSIVFYVPRANMQEGDIFSRVIANGEGDPIRQGAGGEEIVLGVAPDVDSDGGEDPVAVTSAKGPCPMWLRGWSRRTKAVVGLVALLVVGFVAALLLGVVQLPSSSTGDDEVRMRQEENAATERSVCLE